MPTPAEKLYSYDAECERLARYFLADEPHATEASVRDLAQEIQVCIEDWLSVRESAQDSDSE